MTLICVVVAIALLGLKDKVILQKSRSKFEHG